jgi:hypothetical protein
MNGRITLNIILEESVAVGFHSNGDIGKNINIDALYG